MAIGRPKSIVWFDWLFWSSVILGYMGDGYFDRKAIAFALLLGEVIGLGIIGVVWYYISQRANNVLKWIYTVLAFGGVGLFGLAIIASTFEIEFLGNIWRGLSIPELALGGFINILSAVAATCLFLKPSRVWFESKGRLGNDGDHLSDIFK